MTSSFEARTDSSSGSTDAAGGGLMDMLAANVQIMGQSTSSSSACEKQCRTEQAAIVACIDDIRSARENHNGSSSSASVESESTDSEGEEDSADTSSSGKVECLAPAVAAWTKCCSDANGYASTTNG